MNTMDTTVRRAWCGWPVLRAVVWATAVLCAVAIAAEETATDVPVLRVPKLATAPVLDGLIGRDEWKGAAGFAGLTEFKDQMSLPEFLQPVWYVGYDDAYLYLAFHSPLYPKGTVRAKAKTKRQAEDPVWSRSLLVDDHAEIQICNIGRDKAVSGHFYKFMTNPWDAVCDMKVRYSIGLFGYEYNSETIAKSRLTDEAWDQEIAIPLRDLDVDRIQDGDRWVMQAVNAQDPEVRYYAWRAAKWLEFHLFPELVFDSQAIGAQFVGVGDWMHGNPTFVFNLFNSRSETRTVDLSVIITAADGTVLLEQKKEVRLEPGAASDATIAGRDLPLQDRAPDKQDNRVSLAITDAASGAVYYRADMPLRKWNPEVDRYVADLKVARKPAEAKMDYAYRPSSHTLRANADVNILGIEPEIRQNARHFRVAFGKSDAGAMDIIGRNATPIGKDGLAHLTFAFPPLEEGSYRIKLELLDEACTALVSREDTFVREIFPFESFDMGREDALVRPYTALKISGRTVETIGNRIALSDAGLPAQVTSLVVPPEALPELLAAPITLAAVADGKTVELGGTRQAFAWSEQTRPTRVSGTAEGDLAGLRSTVTTEADYTGQILVNVALEPRGRVALDRLELTIPVRDPVDTAFVYGDRERSYVFSNDNPYRDPPANGILWDNLQGRSARPQILYIGNGERGLYWYTDSYEGFWIDRYTPHMVVEKTDGATLLRVALINRSCVIDKPRTLRFAFVATPMKPQAADFRTFQWNQYRMHLGLASWWGSVGCFVFPRTEEEYRAWRKGGTFEYNGVPTPGVYPKGAPPQGSDGPEKGKDYGVYRAAGLIGYLQPELKTFAGEWVDLTNPPFSPRAAVGKDKDGNPIWPAPEQRAIYDIDPFTQSLYDYESYQFYLIAKGLGVGGYWWDWTSFVQGSSLEKGSMYLDDEGIAQPRNNLFLVRAFYERIARIARELGVPDANNVYAPGPVYQVPWLTRINSCEAMYLESDRDDMFTAQGIDKYRLLIGKYSGLPVQLVMNVPIHLEDPRARSIVAMALLHDNGMFTPTLTPLLEKIGFFEPDLEWIPYWRSGALVTTRAREVLVTAYRNRKTAHTLLVAVNPTGGGVSTDLRLTVDFAKAVDAESEKALPVGGRTIRGVAIGRHDFRLLALDRPGA